MGRLVLSLLAVMALSALAEEVPLTAATRLTSEPAAPVVAGYPVDDHHLLKPAEGVGWVMTDTRSGEEKRLILPAFHPENSRPVMAGDKLAYVSFTKLGDQSQLGCITFDLTKGKVLNRRDTGLTMIPDASAVSTTRIGDGGQHATCVLRGQRCGGRQATACNNASEDVTLSFVPLEEAKRGLKGKKGGKKGSKGLKHGKGKPPRAVHGAKSGKTASHYPTRSATRKVRSS